MRLSSLSIEIRLKFARVKSFGYIAIVFSFSTYFAKISSNRRDPGTRHILPRAARVAEAQTFRKRASERTSRSQFREGGTRRLAYYIRERRRWLSVGRESWREHEFAGVAIDSFRSASVSLVRVWPERTVSSRAMRVDEKSDRSSRWRTISVDPRDNPSVNLGYEILHQWQQRARARERERESDTIDVHVTINNAAWSCRKRVRGQRPYSRRAIVSPRVEGTQGRKTVSQVSTRTKQRTRRINARTRRDKNEKEGGKADNPSGDNNDPIAEMEFKFNVNKLLPRKINKVMHNLVPEDFKGDRRELKWVLS